MNRPKSITKLKEQLKLNQNIRLTDFNLPLTNNLPTPKLRDILEENVDEKYYLRNETVEKIVRESGFEERMVSFRKDKE